MTGTSYRLHDSTGHWIARLFGAMRRDFDRHLAEHGVTIIEWAVLAGLTDGAADTPSALADYSGSDRAVVSRALRRMVEKRLIFRRESDRDGRSITIGATAKGLRIGRVLMRANREINDSYFSGLSKQDLASFRRTLKRAVHANGASTM